MKAIIISYCLLGFVFTSKAQDPAQPISQGSKRLPQSVALLPDATQLASEKSSMPVEESRLMANDPSQLSEIQQKLPVRAIESRDAVMKYQRPDVEQIPVQPVKEPYFRGSIPDVPERNQPRDNYLRDNRLQEVNPPSLPKTFPTEEQVIPKTPINLP